MNADEYVGERVHMELFRQRFTKRQLADRLGVSESSVSRKVLGDSTFTLDELLVVARFFEMPLIELLPGDDYEPQLTGKWREKRLALVGTEPSEGERDVRHQGLEPRTRWFDASPGQLIELRPAA